MTFLVLLGIIFVLAITANHKQNTSNEEYEQYIIDNKLRPERIKND